MKLLGSLTKLLFFQLMRASRLLSGNPIRSLQLRRAIAVTERENDGEVRACAEVAIPLDGKVSSATADDDRTSLDACGQAAEVEEIFTRCRIWAEDDVGAVNLEEIAKP